MKLPLTFGIVASAAMSLAPAASFAHDYPTIDRVRYVQACMGDHPGPHYEMTEKCVCVVDTLARELPYADFESMTVAEYGPFRVRGTFQGTALRFTTVSGEAPREVTIAGGEFDVPLSDIAAAQVRCVLFSC